MKPSEDPAFQQFFADSPWQIDNSVIHENDYLMVDNLINRSLTIFGVGANKGQSIAYFLSIFPDATVHSFECNPVMIEVLLEFKNPP